MCSCEEGEPVDVYVHEVRKARKDHRCCECRGLIAVGTKHGYWRWLFDGSWEVSRRCPACAEKASAFSVAEGCRAMVGLLNEQIRECAEEDPDFARNYLKARREVRRARQVA